MLVALERVMLKEHPDWVVVYGDTNSTLAGALAAAKLRIPVAHVEAGLRSYNRAMPEETNRVIADHVADLLLAPTRASVANLRREGIDPRKIVRVGDVMYDAARFYAEKAQCVSRVHGRLQLNTGQYVLATIHRAENTESIPRLHAIFGALRRLAREIVVVVPIHPRTRKVLARSGWRASGGLHLIDPVGYLDMVMLERGARLIATDSGGMQKEAYFYRVPCATLRAETEWVELVEMGWNRLVPVVDHRTVYRELQSMMTSFRRPSLLSAPYGNGHTAELIVKALRDRCPSRP
jgi:UDP-GlcNAc3NAcA epimerase